MLGDPVAAAAGRLFGSLVLDGAEDKRALLVFFGDVGAADEITLLDDDDDESEGSGRVAEGCSS